MCIRIFNGPWEKRATVRIRVVKASSRSSRSNNCIRDSLESGGALRWAIVVSKLRVSASFTDWTLSSTRAPTTATVLTSVLTRPVNGRDQMSSSWINGGGMAGMYGGAIVGGVICCG